MSQNNKSNPPKDKCDLCQKEVPSDYICRFTPDGVRFEKECLLLCRDCLDRTGIAGFKEKKPAA